MKWRFRYMLSALPVALAVGGWRLSAWAYAYFNCTGTLKNLNPCHAGNIDLLPLLGFGLFWCQILTWVAAPASIWLLIETTARQIGSRKDIQS
ncbi:hypothetical protein [Niveibacterium terrae]|uniref:hypothetical protein n=1 Tax=Niveibacterium terrae TaxID=3373598 RepID=UPI003A91B730